MERSELVKELNVLFISTLDNEQIVLNEGTQASDIEEWDSLTHILLVVAVEKKYKIKFNSAEIMSWKNLGEMMDSILKRSK